MDPVTQIPDNNRDVQISWNLTQNHRHRFTWQQWSAFVESIWPGRDPADLDNIYDDLMFPRGDSEMALCELASEANWADTQEARIDDLEFAVELPEGAS